MKDSRERQWVWEGYRPNTTGFSDLYNTILNFQTRLRVNANKSEWMFLKEDISKNLTEFSWNGSSFDEVSDFIRVKVTDVARTPVTDSRGYVRYETTMTFIIDDDQFNGF